ncbi:MAG TPA: hypothetical protein ENN18_01945 [Proteobacteria bacterium]|nr:hypothetical protein [Pseudomonadota bacterium]
MKLKDLFKTKKKQKTSGLSQILNGNEIFLPDDPFVIYFACSVVSRYSEILVKSLGLSNVSEEILPCPKKDIQKAIELILNFLKNENNSWERLKEEYADIAELLITNNYYKALRVGYIELAKFIPKEDAEICFLATAFLNELENKGKTNEETVLAVRENPWLNKAFKVSEEIKENKVQRLKYLQENYGKEDFIFVSHS